jgi:pilus assembly protein CpaC
LGQQRFASAIFEHEGAMIRSAGGASTGAVRDAFLACALALGVGGAMAAPSAALAQATEAVTPGALSEVTVAAGKSRVIELPERYASLMIADPKTADVLPLSTNSIYVVGKAPGSTALSVYGPGKRLLAAVNVVVTGDLEGLKRRVHDILPDERNVQVRAAAGNSIVLSGTASSPTALNQILLLAETYAPKQVVNMMTVEGAQQVMLTVRFVEMKRSTAKDLRINTQITGHTNTFQTCTLTVCTATPVTKPTFAANTGDTVVNPGLSSDSFAKILGMFRVGSGDVTMLIDALETKGIVKTLAEPTLVAMSGDTANFLAGGEFPIPIAQSGSGAAGGTPAITVEFKQFGIGLGFTPTILKDGLINMVVNPEVSAIDPATSVTVGGLVVPGLSVRRAHTTIELRDGESFTIAGLLAENYANNVRQLPFVGDVPVLGALFRSTGFQRDDTELVIVVTPHLAVPHRGPTALPGDHFVPPSDFELFVIGAQTGAAAQLRPEDRALMSVDPSKGGIDGPHGHVLY